MRVAHFADLHLDMPFSWAPPDAARRRRQALRDTLGAIADLAIRERVDTLLCGGDLFEHERITPDTVMFLRSTFARIDPIRVFLAPGNHDYYDIPSPYAHVDWSANVHVFTGGLEPVELEAGLTLWGGGHRVPANTPNLLHGFSVGREGVNIALFHGSERGWLTAQGENKEPHAPFDAVDIARAGLDHAFLGHFHAPKDTDLFTYPGNPDPLSFGEWGERGVVIAEILPDGSVNRSRHRVAVSEVHDVGVDISGSSSVQDVRDALSEAVSGLHGFARATLRGELAADVSLDPRELSEVPTDLQALLIHVGAVIKAYDLEFLAEQATVQGQFIRDIQASPLSEDDKRRVIVTGLRALDGRQDLEVL